jgi:outer membrane protein OmpA-like peptidoglycan-associated protein
VTVTSNQDGPTTADQSLTLREAVEIVNGTLPLTDLSQAERQLVTPISAGSQIVFNLPAGNTAIELQTPLPDLTQPGLTLDGTTQPGYDPGRSATAEILVPVPVVVLRPAAGAEVLRGLTLVADDITVRGLSLYGFTSRHGRTESTPPADIFIAHPLPPPDISQQRPPASYFAFRDQDRPPQGIVIEQNWLGIPPDEHLPDQPSAFGVSVFNAQGATIRQNRIAFHDGSGIITGARAENLAILDNLIINNGLAGMPDGLRLEGRINNGLISGNLICGNDGSGIFLFKPEGAVDIRDNDIRLNGQRFRRAAVYLMGNDHQVIDNQISNQKGPGVVVTAFSQGGTTNSRGNRIQNNQFANLEGLSIDLNTRRHWDVQDFQRGDGPNPQRESGNRRRDTGNAAVNAPQFLSPEFFVIDGQVVVQGKADPGVEVQLYRSQGRQYGPLNTPLATVTTDAEGRFSYASSGLKPGDVISAIATDSVYGTSEPALNTVILALGETVSVSQALSFAAVEMPQCTTPPVSPSAPLSVAPEAITLEVPRQIHFGLDEAVISPASAQILSQIAEVLQAYPTIIVDLYGHTDSRASASYNQDLARRRAENTRWYLIRAGIAPERLTIRSLGETQLLVEETDRLNYARNRRVEFGFSDVRGVEIVFVNQEDDLQVEP